MDVMKRENAQTLNQVKTRTKRNKNKHDSPAVGQVVARQVGLVARTPGRHSVKVPAVWTVKAAHAVSPTTWEEN